MQARPWSGFRPPKNRTRISIVRHYISVVRYRYTDTPATNEWRFENPLGFQVYNYRRDQETVTPGGEE
ncbi:VirB8/TrbF family protein (plasmid) [Sinorhizobium meliloti]|nr:VirB8/TrbF family protein [Sinorhizobium meliloti]